MSDIQELAINTIRFLAADGVQTANSGHPGLPMGTAAIAYTIWSRHLRFNPINPEWLDRDRFILSGGHGSMLLYTLLHLTGFDLPLDELKNFRQWGSRTPGHPEYGLTPGVETTTGPLGQGFANGVGMAIGEAHLAALFNQTDFQIINHHIFGIVTDGDLMEGVSSEAASLAGHLKLGRIIYFYDDNHITIDGSTDLAFTEDRGKRFEAYGWQVLRVADGNDIESIDGAIKQAKMDPRPSLIICRTHIGFGLPTRQDTSKAHGEPPGEEELAAAKIKVGWPVEPKFFIPPEVKQYFLDLGISHGKTEEDWKGLARRYSERYPEEWAELQRMTSGRLPTGWDTGLPIFLADPKGVATRVASGQVINSLAAKVPELMGGSADLTPSNNTWIKESTAFQAENPSGRYIHFGVREHGMGGIVNGLAYHKGLIPFGATFLVFTDYMRGSIRLSALSHLQTIWIMTHDSIGLGEDGPTHQPIEQLSALRAIPNLNVIRPADANETREAWKAAILRKDGPTLIALTRQALPILDRGALASEEGLHQGAYILADLGQGIPDLILMAAGSEVSLILEAAYRLRDEGINVRVVSFPCWELFESADEKYQKTVFPPEIRTRLAVEMGVAQGWEKWTGIDGEVVSIEKFGASAPYKILYEKYGFTVENVYQTARKLWRKRGHNAHSSCL